jgi:hypothetical protein
MVEIIFELQSVPVWSFSFLVFLGPEVTCDVAWPPFQAS